MKKRCMNCNQIGHIYKHCKSPLNSYGIILFRYNLLSEKIEYLMIQRRHTFGYVEIIRGNYDESNYEYIKRLLGEMTVSERQKLSTETFPFLWKDLWLQDEDEESHFSKDFKKAERKFANIHEQLMILHQQIPILWEIPEWGFPKGKKELHETYLQCAIRECLEETNITTTQYNILQDVLPVEETFQGTDNKVYRHSYFVAQILEENFTPQVNTSNILQVREVGNMKWFSLQEALLHIRPYNIEKKDLLVYLNKKLVNHIKKLN